MPLNKLDNFLKNTEGRILYVNPNDLDATDSITNQGNALSKPFKTIQRALLEAARFSYLRGNNNDITEKTTILLFPGEHTIDNRPGFAIRDVGGTAYSVSPSGLQSVASLDLSLTLTSNFDITQSDNVLYKYNSVNGGVIVPRGTSIVGLDLRKTKVRAKYVPNPTDSNVPTSAIFRITGACYFWQFSLFDADPSSLVYVNNVDFSSNNVALPTFSHHKLTCFEYADGVNKPTGYDLTDLDMYYAKLSNAFNVASGRNIDQKYPSLPLGFAKRRPEWEIVGAFATDPISISSIVSGDGFTPSTIVTVTTTAAHGLQSGTPIKINGCLTTDYNISTFVQNVISATQFTYLLQYVRVNLPANPSLSNAKVVIETDTVSGASPYIFNISLRSVWGMNGMFADGARASGFRSMVVAQFTGVTLQKDDRAFVKYNQSSRSYQAINYPAVTGAELASGSSSTDPATVYHLDPLAIYRRGWENTHIKLANDAFIQVVSVFAIGYTNHFEGQTGADVSITNSNSNFGQNSLNASGFKKDAFLKDDTSYVTSIVTPRAVTNTRYNSAQQSDIAWVSFDVGLTTAVGVSSHLYLYGFNTPDNIPPNIIQGYRVGGKFDEKVYIGGIDANGHGISTATVFMSDTIVSASLGSTFVTGANSYEKVYSVSSGPTALNSFQIGAHGLLNGEKIRVFSDDGDLPENIEENKVYYAIVSQFYDNLNGDPSLPFDYIKLASSTTNAALFSPVTVYGGTNLKIVSRVSDKDPGDLGSPLQYDIFRNNWFVHVNSNNGIYQNFLSFGADEDVGFGPRSPVSYFKRTSDSRGNDEKVYKLRVVIPKEIVDARDPIEGYVIQESSSNGARTNSDFTLSSLTSNDYAYNRNPRFISTCTTLSNVVTTVCDLPHNLKVDDIVVIENVTDTTNPTGLIDVGYNGTFKVSSIVDDKTFTYPVVDNFGVLHTPGTCTSNIDVRSTSLPKFQKLDLQSNFYIYRNEVIKPYIYGIQDGVYHLYVLNAKNAVPVEFTNYKYSQNVINLYPQLDRDNLEDNPRSAKSFAKRFPVGDVATDNQQKSITRETVDQFVKDFGIGLGVSFVSTVGSATTVTFDRPHGIAGIITYSALGGGSAFVDGTYYNVKLFNNSGLTSWNGATAKVTVSAGSVAACEIIEGGSAYTPGQTLYFDNVRLKGPSASATITINEAGITTSIGHVIQFTGAGTTDSVHSRIRSVPSTTQISIAKTAGDPSVVAGQYAFITAPGFVVQSTQYNSTVGITTFNFIFNHGLLSGNKFRVLDQNNNNLGDYIVNTRNSVTAFSAYTGKNLVASGVTPSYVLRHGLSANAGISDITAPNVNIRDIAFFENDYLKLVNFTDDTHIQVTGQPLSSAAIPVRFPLGTYIQIDNEIMRIVSNSLGGAGADEITVIRGVLGTIKQTHDVGSLMKKIKPIAIEFRRPSVLRASNQTFEYLGYGPGNYSTALPQLQITNLTDKQTRLAQAQQRSCGTVVYTGMNNNGDFFLGSKKTNAKTGQEEIFDAPVPTIRGQDPSRLSVTFDEAVIRERLLVEGGNSNTLLSQFNGPVIFNGDATFNAAVNIDNIIGVLATVDSTKYTNGALTVAGGVGIAKNTNINQNLSVLLLTTTGSLSVNNGTTLNRLNVTGISTFNNGINLRTSGAGNGDIFSAGSGISSVFTIANTTNGCRLDLSLRNNSGVSTNTFSVVSAGATVNGTLSVRGNTSITNDLTVSGNSTLNGSLGLNGVVNLAGNFTQTSGTTTLKNTTIDNTLTVATISAHTVSGNLTVNGAITATGDITAFASDERLKTNIERLDNALEKVLKLDGFTYNFNEIASALGFDPEVKHVGVSAQQIQSVLPEAVAPAPANNDYLTVKYEKIVPLLIEAIKELSDEIKDLRKQIKNK